MGLFWKRKSGDQFVSLKLNEPSPKQATVTDEGLPEKEREASFATTLPERELEPVPTGGALLRFQLSER